jgi:thioredoxin reductase (NADPH)
VITDENLGDAWPLERSPHMFETSVPGVFAVGDVRARSVKRVAAAVGEGSVVVQQCHLYLESMEEHATLADPQ